MELLELIFNLLWAFAEVTSFLGDIYAWTRGRENRIERREARKRGLPPPPRDKWNNWVIVLTIIFALLTTRLILWRLWS